jgi:hypothetical protein
MSRLLKQKQGRIVYDIVKKIQEECIKIPQKDDSLSLCGVLLF